MKVLIFLGLFLISCADPQITIDTPTTKTKGCDGNDFADMDEEYGCMAEEVNSLPTWNK